MKNKSNILLLSAFLGGLLFTYLFWTEELGINLLIYSLYIIGINYFNSGIIKSYKFITYAAAHLFAAILVVINNSDLSIIAYYISLILFTGFSHYQQLRTVFSAGFATILQFITLPFNFIQSLSTVAIGQFNLQPILKFARYVFIPAFIVIIFTAVYSGANEVFAHYLNNISTSLSLFLTNILDMFFGDISPIRFVHFCIGVIISAGLLFSFYNKELEKVESQSHENLERTRKSSGSRTIWFKTTEMFLGGLLHINLALKTEYITGIISFTALNILLLSINIIDITTLWLGFTPSANFSADVHQGTNSLIFSIVMAMAVILYFFRGNLNFYSRSKMLRFLAFAWMIQNFILILSVFIKDGYYIEYYGLTHKRIGVLVFASLCIIGLVTVYIKVAKQKTLFYLFKINGHIWFALLLGFSLVNWDIMITKYNINHSDSKSIDPDYLLTLTDKVLPLLDKNRDKLKLQKRIDQRISSFNERYKKTTWLSWNLQDRNTAEYFRLNK